jgi:TctA family transporter
MIALYCANHLSGGIPAILVNIPGSGGAAATTLDGYAKTASVRRKVFGDGPYPAATGVQVAGLIRPGALIEIKATALIG